MKEIPYRQDGDFSWERFEERYNADLANNLGNLVNRVAAMSDRYHGGRLPASAVTAGAAGREGGRERWPDTAGRWTRWPCTRAPRRSSA